ncbi:hypothetical protein [Streptomyces sp. NPDC014894]|uniref:hypothetical protein n=1 Tax=unclassified Streptomyces TaxID=2593676 RepID=UPI0036F75CF2
MFIVTGAVAAGALAGCSGGSSGGGAASEEAARAKSEAALRAELAARSGALRDRYDATIARHPLLAGRLAGPRDSAAEHVAALGGGARSPSASAGASAGATAAPAAVTVPDTEPAALAALADAERRTADGHTAALDTTDPELARLLASMAAAGAAHAYLLTNGDAR